MLKMALITVGTTGGATKTRVETEDPDNVKMVLIRAGKFLNYRLLLCQGNRNTLTLIVESENMFTLRGRPLQSTENANNRNRAQVNDCLNQNILVTGIVSTKGVSYETSFVYKHIYSRCFSHGSMSTR